MEGNKEENPNSQGAKSVRSVRSRGSASCKCSRLSFLSKRIEAASRAATFQIEMGFIEHETQLSNFQILKDITIANAEEASISRFPGEEKVEQQDTKEDMRFQRTLKSSAVVRKRSFLLSTLLLRKSVLHWILTHFRSSNQLSLS